MHAPAMITPTALSDYLAVMSRVVFEPGLNWQVVESKWPGITDAFDKFEVRRVRALRHLPERLHHPGMAPGSVVRARGTT